MKAELDMIVQGLVNLNYQNLKAVNCFVGFFLKPYVNDLKEKKCRQPIDLHVSSRDVGINCLAISGDLGLEGGTISCWQGVFTPFGLGVLMPGVRGTAKFSLSSFLLPVLLSCLVIAEFFSFSSSSIDEKGSLSLARFLPLSSQPPYVVGRGPRSLLLLLGLGESSLSDAATRGEYTNSQQAASSAL